MCFLSKAGKANTALEYSNATTATDGTHPGGTARLTNNRSVVGIHGEESLAYGLKAIYTYYSRALAIRHNFWFRHRAARTRSGKCATTCQRVDLRFVPMSGSRA